MDIDPIGRFYIHVKSGGRYFAHRGTVYHTEDNINLVIYFDKQGRGWARPQTMFEDGRFIVDPDQTPWSDHERIQSEATQAPN